MRIVLCLIGPLLLILSMAGCGGEQPAELTGFAEDYFSETFRFHPTMASRQGLHQYDGRLDNVSSIEIDRRIDSLGRLLARLQTLRRADLTPDARLTGVMLENAIRAELLELQHIRIWKKNPLYYFDIPMRSIDRLMRRPYQPPSDRLRAAEISVNEIESIVASLRANVAAAPKPFVEAGFDEARRFLLLLDTDLPAWGEQAAGVNLRLAGSFQAGVSIAKDSVVETIHWMEQDLAPNAVGEFALGPENFVMKLLFDSMVEMRLSELLQMAEENLEKDYRAFVAVAGEVAPGQSPRAAWRSITASPIPEDQLIATAVKAMDGARRFIIGDGIVPLPDELGEDGDKKKYRFELTRLFRRTPEEAFSCDLPSMMGNDSTAQSEEGLTLKALPKEGYLLLSPPAPRWSPALRAEYQEQLSVENLRLAVVNQLAPGRYLQALRMRGHRLRVAKLLASRVTTDGWAHYAERMMVEEGFGGGDPRLRMTMLQRALVRDCRFVASIRLHTRGMSLAEAAGLFQQKAFLGPAMAALEARRGTYDPLYLSEALGRLLILDLREAYRKAKGPGYALGDFHNEFLSHGGLPIPLIRQLMLSDSGLPAS